MKTTSISAVIVGGTLLSSAAMAYDCSNVPAYTGGSVSTGAILSHNNHAFRCDVGGWCSQGGPYEPGAGWAWEHAWSDLGQCDGNTSSSSSVSSSSSSSSSSVSSSSSSSVSSSSSSSSSSTAGGSCAGVPVWDSGSVYTGGAQVQYSNVKYEARWWTQGDNPSQSGEWGVWNNLGACETTSSSSSSSSSLSSSSSSSSSAVGNDGNRRYVAYASTWNTSIYDLDVNYIPNYVTHVNLAFARPNTVYQAGSYEFDQAVAGFEFVEGASTPNGQKKFTAQQAQDLIDNIAALKARGTEVWVSIGGWSYSQGSGWRSFSASHVVDLALDMGASGIDVDWEASGSSCNKATAASFSCTGDAEIIGIITSLHSEIQSRGADLGISTAGWSTGAYYVAGTPFEEGKVQWGSPFGGTMYNVVKHHGDKLEFLNLMSYDGGVYYDPREGFAAYRAIYNGPINMGMEIAPEGSGGAVLELNAPAGVNWDTGFLTGQNNVASDYYNVETLVGYVKNAGQPNDGFMLWQLWKQRVHAPAPAGAATENSAGQYVCSNLPLAGDCSQTIPNLPKLTP